jgi:nucleoside-diphosphate-sugar epimerase
VRAIVRPGNRKPLPVHVQAIEAPLDDSAVTALADALAASAVVVHAAGLTRAHQPSMFDAANVAGTRAVVEATNRAGTRLVLISSQAAAGTGTTSQPRREGDEPRPVGPYGLSKLASETIVRSQASVPWTILRPSAVYGPRDRQFLPLFRLASRGVSLLATKPSMPFTLIYVADAVRATLLAATEERAAGHTLFLGHPDSLRAEDILRAIAHALERPYRQWRVPGPLMNLAACVGELAWMVGREPIIDGDRLKELRSEGFVCSVDRAREVLGFTAAIGLLEGAARTAQWYQDRGWV